MTFAWRINSSQTLCLANMLWPRTDPEPSLCNLCLCEMLQEKPIRLWKMDLWLFHCCAHLWTTSHQHFLCLWCCQNVFLIHLEWKGVLWLTPSLKTVDWWSCHSRHPLSLNNVSNQNVFHWQSLGFPLMLRCYHLSLAEHCGLGWSKSACKHSLVPMGKPHHPQGSQWQQTMNEFLQQSTWMHSLSSSPLLTWTSKRIFNAAKESETGSTGHCSDSHSSCHNNVTCRTPSLST